VIQYFTYTIRYEDKQHIIHDVCRAETAIDNLIDNGADPHEITVTTSKGDDVIEECSAHEFMGLSFC